MWGVVSYIVFFLGLKLVRKMEIFKIIVFIGNNRLEDVVIVEFFKFWFGVRVWGFFFEGRVGCRGERFLVLGIAVLYVRV